jgi:hypothetical protein
MRRPALDGFEVALLLRIARTCLTCSRMALPMK